MYHSLVRHHSLKIDLHPFSKNQRTLACKTYYFITLYHSTSSLILNGPHMQALGPKSEKRVLRQALKYLREILDKYETTAKVVKILFLLPSSKSESRPYPCVSERLLILMLEAIDVV